MAHESDGVKSYAARGSDRGLIHEESRANRRAYRSKGEL
jgi:hypothetical protein